MKEILEILERDARSSPEQIALQTGLDETLVRAKIHAWESSGIIRRYKAVVDWDRYGRERVLALIDVKVTPARGVGFDDVAERIDRKAHV